MSGQQLQIVKVWLHPHDRIIALFTLITNGRPPHHPAARPSRSIDDLLGDPLLVFIAHLNPSIGLAAPKRQRCGARAHPKRCCGLRPQNPAVLHSAKPNPKPCITTRMKMPSPTDSPVNAVLKGLAVTVWAISIQVSRLNISLGVLAPRAVGSTTSPLRPIFNDDPIVQPNRTVTTEQQCRPRGLQ